MDSMSRGNVRVSTRRCNLFPKPPFTNSEFLLGRNHFGKWVAQDKAHRCGGVFVNRREALKYALSMNGNRMQAVIFVCEPLELGLESPDPRQ